MEQNIEAKIEQWLTGPYDQATKDTIKALVESKNEAELTDSFYKNLEFGTGGLRGLMGVGSNKVNIYTIATATQGLSNYLLATYPGQPIKVVVAYDSRNNSQLFAQTTAAVFSANGIHVYLFAELRPTPQLSFAIRQLGAQSGVVITASHNPKEYNGYKAYWNDGGQIIAPHDKNIIGEVDKIASYADVKADANQALITMLGADMDNAYLDYLQTLSISKEAIARQSGLKIIYSSIHGTGITLVPKILARMGFTNVQVVEAQATPDGNFPTVVYPNPEEREAMSMALALAKQENADLIIATDPDADRVGMGLRNADGEYVLLNGNQTASILFFYMLEAWKNAGKLDGHQMLVKTIVTTDLLDKIAADYGVNCYNTLTGFKYIAGVIGAKEGKEKFICGGEESYGYLIGDQVRDKDAIVSCAMIAEMVAYAKDKGQSLFDFLVSIYSKYGFYHEDLISITKKGKTGTEEIAEMMKQLRANPPASLGGQAVVRLLDYSTGKDKNLATKAETAMDFEKSNVLQFLCADGTKVSARPSGTEPKIKFYFSVVSSFTTGDTILAKTADAEARIKVIQKELNLI